MLQRIRAPSLSLPKHFCRREARGRGFMLLAHLHFGGCQYLGTRMVVPRIEQGFKSTLVQTCSEMLLCGHVKDRGITSAVAKGTKKFTVTSLSCTVLSTQPHPIWVQFCTIICQLQILFTCCVFPSPDFCCSSSGSKLCVAALGTERERQSAFKDTSCWFVRLLCKQIPLGKWPVIDGRARASSVVDPV